MKLSEYIDLHNIIDRIANGGGLTAAAFFCPVRGFSFLCGLLCSVQIGGGICAPFRRRNDKQNEHGNGKHRHGLKNGAFSACFRCGCYNCTPFYFSCRFGCFLAVIGFATCRPSGVAADPIRRAAERGEMAQAIRCARLCAHVREICRWHL